MSSKVGLESAKNIEDRWQHYQQAPLARCIIALRPSRSTAEEHQLRFLFIVVLIDTDSFNPDKSQDTSRWQIDSCQP